MATTPGITFELHAVNIGSQQATNFALTYTTLAPLPTQPVSTMPNARARKIHLAVDSSKGDPIAGIPVLWAACNLRSRPDWFQKRFPILTRDLAQVTCKNCLRRGSHK